MKNKVAVRTLKYKILKPLLSCLLIFSLLIFVSFNLFLKKFLTLSQDSKLNNIYLIKSNIILFIILITFVIIFVIVLSMTCKSISKSLLLLSTDTESLITSSYRINKLKDFSCTEIQNLNLSIHKLAKKLEYYYISQKIALANASHELRTPLMSIQGYAEGIKYNVFDDINEPLDIIIEESIHLRNTVNSILKLSELDSQNVKVDYQYINLYSTLNRLANKLRGIAFKTNKNILIQGDKNICINTDENLLSEAVTNLLSNALRYANKNITIEFFLINNLISINITDDGNGISDNDFENLFTRFYKGNNGNLGLGLSIAQSSIQYLGGNITASNLEIGACFSIKFNNN